MPPHRPKNYASSLPAPSPHAKRASFGVSKRLAGPAAAWGPKGDRGRVHLPKRRYLGGRLLADVRADKSRAALTREPREPDETPIWADDEVGRNVVATLKQAGTRKGTAGALGRLVDSGGRRRHREQLLKTRDAPRPPAHRRLAAVINHLQEGTSLLGVYTG
jgi:hypothetical protein